SHLNAALGIISRYLGKLKMNYDEKILSVKTKLGKAFDTEDDLGMVIRSHIVLENLVEEYISSKTVCEKSVSKLKLTFEQKIYLAVSLGFDPRFEKPLKAIATIRNRFAHNLRGCLDKSDANNFYKSFSEIDKTIMYESVLRHFRGDTNEEKPDKSKFSVYVMCLTIAITSFNLKNNRIAIEENA
ncbi:hypothetical protein, partial [Vibrio genomosp. F10]|uniref:hypothetical protein n=1 Tax=Vibrio genomosp. F10 TaxID=723171 RepID=UPI00036C497B